MTTARNRTALAGVSIVLIAAVAAYVPFPDLNGDGVVDGSEFPFD